MAELLPTYEYHGDTINAVFEGRVIASGTDFAKVSCSAEEYFNCLTKKRKDDEHEAARKAATHITTPNGAKGEILNRVASLWGEQITVRFENGQIRRFDTMAGDERLSYIKEEPDQPKNMQEYFSHKLEEDYHAQHRRSEGSPGYTLRDPHCMLASRSIRVQCHPDAGVPQAGVGC